MDIQFDEFGRLVGSSIKAHCDYEGCTRSTARDVIHQCMTDMPGIGCGGYMCGSHILITGYGMICRSCYTYHERLGRLGKLDE